MITAKNRLLPNDSGGKRAIQLVDGLAPYPSRELASGPCCGMSLVDELRGVAPDGQFFISRNYQHDSG